MSNLEALFAQIESTENPLNQRVAEDFANNIQLLIKDDAEPPDIDGLYVDFEHKGVRDRIYLLGRNWVGVNVFDGATNAEVAIQRPNGTYFHYHTLGAGKEHLEARIANKLTMWQFVHDIEDMDASGMMCDMSAEQIIEGCTRSLFSDLDDKDLALAISYGMYYREALIGFLENYYLAVAS